MLWCSCGYDFDMGLHLESLECIKFSIILCIGRDVLCNIVSYSWILLATPPASRVANCCVSVHKCLKRHFCIVPAVVSAS